MFVPLAGSPVLLVSVAAVVRMGALAQPVPPVSVIRRPVLKLHLRLFGLPAALLQRQPQRNPPMMFAPLASTSAAHTIRQVAVASVAIVRLQVPACFLQKLSLTLTGWSLWRQRELVSHLRLLHKEGLALAHGTAALRTEVEIAVRMDSSVVSSVRPRRVGSRTYRGK